MTMTTPFTLIDETRVTRVDAKMDDGRVLVDPGGVERATGWVRKPEGLCRDEVCVPVRNAGLDRDGRIDLEVMAQTLHRPIAVDTGEGAAALGTSAVDRGNLLASLEAPDITLPDLDGRTHSLSEHRGKKVLLVVYASW